MQISEAHLKILQLNEFQIIFLSDFIINLFSYYMILIAAIIHEFLKFGSK